MKLGFTRRGRAFRTEAADWLSAALAGAFAGLRGVTGLTARPEERRAWEQALGRARWSVLGWPHGIGRPRGDARRAGDLRRGIRARRRARAARPPRRRAVGPDDPRLRHRGAEDALPAADRRRRRDLVPGLFRAECGLRSANVRTRARLEQGRAGEVGDRRPEGLDHARAVRRLDLRRCAQRAEGSRGRRGPDLPAGADQPAGGLDAARSARSPATRSSTRLFFDGARTAADSIIGAPGEGWKVAMGSLAFERGVSTLGAADGLPQRARRDRRAARANGTARDPLIRQRIAKAQIGLQIMRYSALRMLSEQRDRASRAARR